MILKMSKSDDDAEFATSCSYCERKFSQHRAFYVHMRKFHKDEPITYKHKSKIICSLCNEGQVKFQMYWDHIRSKHPEVKLSFEKKFFYSEEDFTKWKTEVEDQTHAHFNAVRSQNVLRDGTIVQRLLCDRSGFYRPSGTSTRKFSGSKKIGKYCPAQIYRTKTVVGDLMEIEVDFQSTHMGHKFDVHGLRVRSEQRERRLRSQGKGRWPKKLKNNSHNEKGTDDKFDLHGLHVRSEQYERRLRSQRKRRCPKKLENNSHNENRTEVKNVPYESTESVMMEISDILQRDPDLEIQEVTCTCHEYVVLATCEHVKTILNSINMIKSMPQEKINHENGRDTDSSCVDTETAAAEAEDFVNPMRIANVKSIKDKKALLIEKFNKLVNKCHDWEQLDDLEKIVAEGNKYLFSAPECELKNSSHSSGNIGKKSSTSFPVGSTISTPSLNTTALSPIKYPLYTYQTNLMTLRKGINILTTNN